MLENKIVELSADIATLWSLQCKNLYNSKNLAALAVRECVQNSLDSIQQAIKSGVISQGKIDISWDSDENTLTITDNGMGMDIATLHNKFLTLGGTTKGDADSTGGFGIAKSVILGCGEGFKIHTQDNEFGSEDLGINPIHKTEWIQGTTITLYKPQVDIGKTISDKVYILQDAIEDYIYSSTIPKNTVITLNGEPQDYKFIPTKKSRRIPAELGVSSSMIPSDTTLNINVFKTSSSIHYLYVRLRGLTQFKTYLSWNANCDITLDFQTTLDPRSSEYPFSTNREGLKAHYQGIVEAIRDKVSQSPTSISRDDRFKETIYDNVSTNVCAAKNLVTSLTTPQVINTVKSTVEVVKDIKKRGGMIPQGGYTPSSILDYVSQTVNTIEETAEKYNTTNEVVIDSIQPKTLFQLNNPLSHSWLVYEDTEYKDHRRLSQSTQVELVVIWDSILNIMASNNATLFSSEENKFYPGLVIQENTLGLCVEKYVYPEDSTPEQRKYVMVNPFEVPQGSSLKIALWLMNTAAHELAHVIGGSYEAHGETHSYLRERIMNQSLDNVEDVQHLVENAKLMKTLKKRVHSKIRPYRQYSTEQLISLADTLGINTQAMQDRYPDPKIFRMRLVMEIKKVNDD